MARSGQALASALTTASTISFEQWEVHIVTGAPSRGSTMVPSLAMISIGRKQPSFFATSGSSRKAIAMRTALAVLGQEELRKEGTCGADSDRSTVIASPCFVTVARMAMSLWPKPSSSRKASPFQVPSFQVAMMRRACASDSARMAATAASVSAAPCLSSTPSSRFSPRCAAPIIAIRSPRTSRGRRVLVTIMRTRSGRAMRPCPSRIGGSRSPSWKISVAAGL